MSAPKPDRRSAASWESASLDPFQHHSGPVVHDTARLSQRYPPPPLCAMGFLVSQHGQLGAIPPPPFLSVSPLENMRSGGAIPPPPLTTKGVSQRYLRDALRKQGKTRAIPPSAMPSRKGIAQYGGGYLAFGLLSSSLRQMEVKGSSPTQDLELDPRTVSYWGFSQDSRKAGLSLKNVAFHDGFGSLGGGSGEHAALPSACSKKCTTKRQPVNIGHAGYPPLNSTPLVRQLGFE